MDRAWRRGSKFYRAMGGEEDWREVAPLGDERKADKLEAIYEWYNNAWVDRVFPL